MPVFGLGTWRSEKDSVRQAVYNALKEGYIQIDAAWIYQNQAEVGQGIADAVKDNIIASRKEVFVVSKLWCTAFHPSKVRKQCEETLSQLGLEQIDQYLMHWPTAMEDKGEPFPTDDDGNILTDEVDICATWQEMETLVEEGLVRSIGVSNFNEQEIEQILAVCKIPPAVNQVECHPYWNQNKLRSFCDKKGIQIVAYSPLGNFNPGDAESISPLKDEDIFQIAQSHGKTPAQVILRWSLQKGNVCIPKTTSEARIHENADIFDFELSEAEMEVLENIGLSKSTRLCNPPFRPGGIKVFNDHQ